MTARDMGSDLVLVSGNWLLRLPGQRFRLAVLRHLMRVDIDRSSSVERGVRLLTRGGVSIGRRCNVNRGVVLDGRGGLEIGCLVNISPEALLLTAEHVVESPDFEGRFAKTVIGDRCWVATRAILLPGSTLGDGVVVGAGSVVSGNIDPWTVVAGSPARPVRRRSADAQQDLMQYRRWMQ